MLLMSTYNFLLLVVITIPAAADCGMLLTNVLLLIVIAILVAADCGMRLAST